MHASFNNPKLPGPFELSNEQVASFFRDGYLGPLPRFASFEMINSVAENLLRVEQEKISNPLYGRYSPRDWHLIDPNQEKMLTHDGLVKPLQQLMGDNLLLWRSKAFIKPPFGAEIGWHQEWGPFDGAEIGSSIPALLPTVSLESPWNITVWIALEDIDDEMGPIRFIRGSHTRHFPVDQVPLPDSAFFEDPFEELRDPLEIVRRAENSTLVLDIDTSAYFKGVNLRELTFESARKLVLEKLRQRTGEVMIPTGVDLNDYVAMPMRKGEFVIFYERTLHGSAKNQTNRYRPAVNCRVTLGSTIVYPQRLRGEYIDGSNLNIQQHYCIPLSGTSHHKDNVYPSKGPR